MRMVISPFDYCLFLINNEYPIFKRNNNFMIVLIKLKKRLIYL
jgi:hypothetical protein